MTVPLARPSRRAAWVDGLTAPVVAGALALVAALAHWRGADAPNYLFRFELFKRAGFTLWNVSWYAGHHTPGYSVLLPPLMALGGPAVVGVGASVLAAAAFDRVLRSLPGTTNRRRIVASLVFAASTCTNLAVGRLAFAVGLALALSAAMAGQRGHRLLALVLSPLATLASPVAGVFLAIGWVAWWAVRRSWWPVVWAFAALAPAAVVAVAFPEGGTFPFRWLALVTLLALGVLAMVALPSEASVVRVGVAVYLLACIGTFIVPNPLGANITRLGMYGAAPLFVASARLSRRWLVPVVVVLVWWQWSPAIDSIVRSGHDPSTSSAYYSDLVGFLQERTPSLERIEIPFTRRHFEAAYVAPVVPLARGWERQLDMKSNPLFYEPAFDAATYHRWLDETGVQLVALPDVELDASARQEAAIVRSMPPFLRPVWSDPHWQVFEVVGSTGLVTGPATVFAQNVDSITLDATGPGEVLVREHWTNYWTIDGPACVQPSHLDDWVHITVEAPGRLLLRPTLSGPRARCDQPA